MRGPVVEARAKKPAPATDSAASPASTCVSAAAPRQLGAMPKRVGSDQSKARRFGLRQTPSIRMMPKRMYSDRRNVRIMSCQSSSLRITPKRADSGVGAEPSASHRKAPAPSPHASPSPRAHPAPAPPCRTPPPERDSDMGGPGGIGRTRVAATAEGGEGGGWACGMLLGGPSN